MRAGKSVRLKILLSVLFLVILCIAGYSYRNRLLFDSITVSVLENRVVEYGTESYDTVSMLSDVSGSVSVLKDVNTNKVGEQVVLFQIEKSNVKRNIPVMIEVVDSIAPIIELHNETIYVNSGKNYDVSSNIKNVSDNVDGEMVYISNTGLSDEEVNYYTISGFVNTNIVGSYEVEVKAVDSSGNSAVKNFEVIVTSHGKENNLKNVAYSLLGKPYIFGGNNLNGFDCSGFVQYVYSRNGMSVGRSATDQLYSGYEVSYNNIRIGDIIVWGYGVNNITHTAIYVGNGLMIHAANPSDGVVVNNVAGWGDYTQVHIVSVRRLA